MSLKNYNILLIDDDELDRQHISRMLAKSRNFTVDIELALTEQDGIEKYHHSAVDCILLDYTLPGTTGLEFIKKIKNQTDKDLLPIIMLTGSGNENIAVEAMRLGIADYISKEHLTTERLYQSINSCVHAHQLKRELVKKEQELKHLALLDPLTSIPNRRAFDQTFEQFIASSKRYKRLSALLFIDLDGFKNINDTLGHDVGDDLLVEVTARLKHLLRKDDFIARLGGDEFGVLLSEIKNEHDAGIIAKKICNAMQACFSLADKEIYTGVSIGIVCFVSDTESKAKLLQRADIAMYQAKKERKKSYQFYEESLHKQHAYRLVLEHESLNCIKNNELNLVYQPIVNLSSCEIVGFEALIRWRCKKLNKFVSPEEFIPVIERSGFIHQLGMWVIEKAFSQVSLWKKQYGFKGTIAINISPIQLNRSEFYAEMNSFFKQHQIAFNHVHFELTEQSVMENINEVSKYISVLYDTGIKFQIDDFGTGYSSLSRLKTLDINTLKIDKEFVKDIGCEDANAIIEAIIALANALRLNVIAEGIETEEQKKFLMESGCQIGQGYYFSKPIDSVQASALLEDNSTNKIMSLSHNE